MSILKKAFKGAGKLLSSPAAAAIPGIGKAKAVLGTARALRAVIRPGGAGSPITAGRTAAMSIAGPGLRVAGQVLKNPAVQGTVGGLIGTSIGRRRQSTDAPRRRRAKGISGSEMKAFRRVTGVLQKLCKTPAPMRRRTGGKSCR